VKEKREKTHLKSREKEGKGREKKSFGLLLFYEIGRKGSALSKKEVRVKSLFLPWEEGENHQNKKGGSRPFCYLSLEEEGAHLPFRTRGEGSRAGIPPGGVEKKEKGIAFFF